MNRIRGATLEDVDQIAKIGLEFADEYPSLEGNLESIKLSTEEILEAPYSAALVADMDGEIVGAIGGVISPSIYNREILQFQEVMWFVSKEYRNTKVGLQLLKSMEKVAVGAGCKWFLMIAPHLMKFEHLDNVYTKMGFTKFETFYRKEIG